MDKFQLAALTQWAEEASLGGIQGRKRMQKVVYLLQQSGCPIDAEFILHRYGPYSHEVANVTDLMVAEELLDEAGGCDGQYVYSLRPGTRQMLERLREYGTDFASYRERAIRLLQEDIWTLELGSTVLFFHRSQRGRSDWDGALEEACAYKRTKVSGRASQRAFELAKKCVPSCIGNEAVDG